MLPQFSNELLSLCKSVLEAKFHFGLRGGGGIAQLESVWEWARFTKALAE